MPASNHEPFPCSSLARIKEFVSSTASKRNEFRDKTGLTHKYILIYKTAASSLARVWVAEEEKLS
jgi:hypothetical protein